MSASCETTVSDLNRSYINNIQQRAILCKMFKKTVLKLEMAAVSSVTVAHWERWLENAHRLLT